MFLSGVKDVDQSRTAAFSIEFASRTDRTRLCIFNFSNGFLRNASELFPLKLINPNDRNGPSPSPPPPHGRALCDFSCCEKRSISRIILMDGVQSSRPGFSQKQDHFPSVIARVTRRRFHFFSLSLSLSPLLFINIHFSAWSTSSLKPTFSVPSASSHELISTPVLFSTLPRAHFYEVRCVYTSSR